MVIDRLQVLSAEWPFMHSPYIIKKDAPNERQNLGDRATLAFTSYYALECTADNQKVPSCSTPVTGVPPAS